VQPGQQGQVIAIALQQGWIGRAFVGHAGPPMGRDERGE
jgi:hypothetical protein